MQRGAEGRRGGCRDVDRQQSIAISGTQQEYLVQPHSDTRQSIADSGNHLVQAHGVNATQLQSANQLLSGNHTSSSRTASTNCSDHEDAASLILSTSPSRSRASKLCEHSTLVSRVSILTEVREVSTLSILTQVLGDGVN
jgi:hypothetical protein